jgi:DHA2 family multidrug resistance protein
MAPVIGANIQRINLRVAASCAFLIFSIGMIWVAGLNEQASFWQLSSPRLWQGLGIPMFFLPLNAILMSHVKPNDLAAASGLSNFTRTIAGSISTAMSVYLLNHRADVHHTVLAEHVRIDSVGWQHMQQTLHSMGVSDTQALGVAERIVSQQASTLAVNDIYTLFAVIFLLLIPLVWLAKPPFGVRMGGGH